MILNIDTILDRKPSGKVKKKRELIKASLGKGLDDVSRMLVKDTLELLHHLGQKVNDTSLEILGRLQEGAKDPAIVVSVPGIGLVSASIILAEIGDYHDFQ
jgi:transposase